MCLIHCSIIWKSFYQEGPRKFNNNTGSLSSHVYVPGLRLKPHCVAPQKSLFFSIGKWPILFDLFRTSFCKNFIWTRKDWQRLWITNHHGIFRTQWLDQKCPYIPKWIVHVKLHYISLHICVCWLNSACILSWHQLISNTPVSVLKIV